MGLVVLGACAPAPPPPTDAPPHADLACAECHQGGVADRAQPATPPDACTAAGCHRSDIPGEVLLASVRFPHRGHGEDAEVAVGCASCHRHDAGEEPLRAGPENCGLCHEEDVGGTTATGCRTCHAPPTHTAVTSQGVPIPHQGLPWIEGGCLRCHYEVATPLHAVPMERCSACHDEPDVLLGTAAGVDLHPTHTGVSCRACHEADSHRIRAMSAAVDLECAGCHVGSHDVAEEIGVLEPVCHDCHRSTHRETQTLLLGLDGGSTATPSEHFMAGLTCSSCHQEGRDAAASGRDACTRCHRSEFADVADWWRQGVDARVATVERYVETAERAAEVAEARRILTLLEEGDGVHNLTLAHRLLGAAVDAAADALRGAGRTPPEPPALGRTPQQGLCVYCHYRPGELGITEEMRGDFHAEVLSGR